MIIMAIMNVIKYDDNGGDDHDGGGDNDISKYNA